MTVAFTICSNNYFAFARVLGKSWLQHHPDTRFVTVLVDEIRDDIDYAFDERAVIWPLEQLGLANLDELVQRYNIVELNTAIKADAYMQVFEHYKADKVLYIDPDIAIYSPLEEVIDLLDTSNIIVTPHYTTPIDDDKSTTDIKMIGSGLFNLGFLALSDLEKVRPFLCWWRDRIYKYGYYDLARNMFYDQVWVNYIIVFFDNYHILKHPGYNMANWNFHERRLSRSSDGNYIVNGQYPLRFFHFSGYQPARPDAFSRYHTRYTFADRPDIVPLYQDYQSRLAAERFEILSAVPCIYHERHKRDKAAAETAAWQQLPVKTKIIRKLAALARKLVHN